MAMERLPTKELQAAEIRDAAIKFKLALAEIKTTGANKESYPGEWKKPWTFVKEAAAQRCASKFDNFQLQAIGMENEKEGYDKMQVDFGMPKNIAQKAKKRCAKQFDDFQLQPVCMENEAEGYAKMQNHTNR